MFYPSGRPVSYQYDNAGRPKSAGGYVTSLSYAAHGAPEHIVPGTEWRRRGNIVQRTDARARITCYGVLAGSSCDGTGYDLLNRPTRKSYSDGTPTVTYVYDQAPAGEAAVPYGWNRLIEVTATGAQGLVSQTRYDEYDALGRVMRSSQRTGTADPYRFSYEYNLAGGLKRQTCPSNRVVSYDYNGGGRVSAVNNLTGGGTYANGVVYAPHGAVQSMTYGNALTETWVYNARLQPASVAVAGATTWGLGYTYEANANCNGERTVCNNGNLVTQTISWLGVTQKYSYDNLNRLTLAAENTSSSANASCPDPNSVWCEGYEYADAYGNRGLASSSNLGLSQLATRTFDPLTNRNTGGQWNPATSYDVAGNVIADPSGSSYSYDAENRMITAGGATYGYDGDGRRVTSASTAGITTYVYDAAGQLAAEYSSQAATVTGPQYLISDHLGSTRLLTDASGTVTECHDFLPFGDGIATSAGPRNAHPCYSAQTALRIKFTGKERHAETGLDYSQYRYSSAAQGRWTSPDPLPGWPADPQSWNRYAYVRNNPLKYVDPLGLSYEVCDENGKNCTKRDLSDQQFADFRKQNTSEIFANGKISYRNEDGTSVQIGTYRRTGDDVPDQGVQVLVGLEQRADASNKLIAGVAAGSAAVGVAGGAFVGFTGLSSGGFATLTTGGEAIGIQGLTADQVALVARWGRAGLQPGDWVMNGGTGVLTYLMSGKWQPGLGNVFAEFSSGQNFLVLKTAVQNPGWVENGLGWIKSLLGQRLFKP